MSYPVDQIIALTKANGQFLLKLAEITRSVGADYAGIGRQGFASAVDQIKAFEPGKVPSLSGTPTATILAEIEKSRDAAAEKAKAAFEEWQGVWQDALSGTGPQEASDAFQKLIAPWFWNAATAKPVEPARPTAKAQEA